jgi:hypothetical protein
MTGMMRGGDDERGEWDIGDIAALALAGATMPARRAEMAWPLQRNAAQRSAAAHDTASPIGGGGERHHKVGPMRVGGEPNPI